MPQLLDIGTQNFRISILSIVQILLRLVLKPPGAITLLSKNMDFQHVHHATIPCRGDLSILGLPTNLAQGHICG